MVLGLVGLPIASLAIAAGLSASLYNRMFEDRITLPQSVVEIASGLAKQSDGLRKEAENVLVTV